MSYRFCIMQSNVKTTFRYTFCNTNTFFLISVNNFTHNCWLFNTKVTKKVYIKHWVVTLKYYFVVTDQIIVIKVWELKFLLEIYTYVV